MPYMRVKMIARRTVRGRARVRVMVMVMVRGRARVRVMVCAGSMEVRVVPVVCMRMGVHART